MDVPVAVVTPRKRIALVAHDNTKADLMEWAQYNRDLLANHELLATGTTGTLLTSSYERQMPEYEAYQNRMVKASDDRSIAELA